MLEQETAETPKKPSWQKQAVKQVVGLLIACGFLYFAFRGANINELVRYSQNLDLGCLALVFLSAVLSHVVRAVRWVILLQPLSQKKISLWNSFCAIMYGYAINIVLPRGGEIARLVAISKTENIPWAGVLPTMFIDRLLDVAMLVLLLGVTISILPAGKLSIPGLETIGISLCLATVVGLLMLPFVGKIIRWICANEGVKKSLPEKILNKADELSRQFDLGTQCLMNPLNLLKIAFLSFFMWTLYWGNLYGMIWAFHLNQKVDLVNSLVVFAIGSIGVLVPTPGSVGSYHFLVSQGLQKAAEINSEQALAFATVLHLVGFVLTTCLPAAFCFIVESVRSAKNKK